MDNNQIKEICRLAHFNAVNFYSRLSKHRHNKEANEHFIVSHFASLSIKKFGFFTSMETNRSLVELSLFPEETELMTKARDENIESNKHRFDAVVWQDEKPMIILEVKGFGSNEVLENDVERLWNIQRRAGALGTFKCVFLYSNWHVKDGKRSWESKATLFRDKNYTFDQFFFEGPKAEFPNWCAGLIMNYEDVGAEYRLK